MDTPQASYSRAEHMADDKQQWALLSEVFTGDEDFDNWLYLFESVSAINRWSDSEKVLWLNVKLVGKAHMAYQRLSNETCKSYKNTTIALRNRFEPVCKKELYKVELNSRTRREGESWADFGDALIFLASKAFPNFQHETLERLALDRYLDQLVPEQLHFSVMQCRPKTMNESVSETIEIEVYLQLSATIEESLKRDKDQCVSLIQTVNDSQIQLSKTLQTLVQRIEELEHLVSPNCTDSRTQQTKNSSYNQIPMHIKCRRCGELGHFARGCAAHCPPKTNQGKTSPVVLYATENQTHNIISVPITVSINSVNSYFLNGTVCNSSVSFLVDTGAGVSLIIWSIWDKLATNTTLKSSVTHNLVGVDGKPISIKGAANVTVTIASNKSL